jgi:hypothetical protein
MDIKRLEVASIEGKSLRSHSGTSIRINRLTHTDPASPDPKRPFYARHAPPLSARTHTRKFGP